MTLHYLKTLVHDIKTFFQVAKTVLKLPSSVFITRIEKHNTVSGKKYYAVCSDLRKDANTVTMVQGNLPTTHHPAVLTDSKTR